MTQALTDGDGRVRDLLERPLARATTASSSTSPAARTTVAFFTKVAVDVSDRRHEPELPRAAAARAVLDDDVPGQLSVDDVRRRSMRSAEDAFVAAAAPWFEGAPRFLARLAAARPFGDAADAVRPRRRRSPLAMPEAEQIELIDAHPRLGAPPATVSASQLPRAGLRPRDDRGDRRARAAERRLRGAVRVPVLRLRQRPVAAGAGARARGGALTADRDAEIRRALARRRRDRPRPVRPRRAAPGGVR